MKVDPRNKRATFIFAGYRYIATPPIMFLGTVSNYEAADRRFTLFAADKFSLYWKIEKREADPSTSAKEDDFIMATAGNPVGIDDYEFQRLQKLVTKRLKKAILNKSAAIIRAAAADPRSAGSVGAQISAAILPADPNQPVSGVYDSTIPSPRIFAPNHLVATSKHQVAIMGWTIEGVDESGDPETIVYPRVGCNAPCPCKSGKKYKKCHGREVC